MNAAVLVAVEVVSSCVTKGWEVTIVVSVVTAVDAEAEEVVVDGVSVTVVVEEDVIVEDACDVEKLVGVGAITML